jgi:hypothetical protein
MANSSFIINEPIIFKSDVQFIVEDQAFEAHLAIVASASPIMAAMFKSGKFQEADYKTVHINDIEPEVFEQMLSYLYTGVVPKMKELAELILLAADKYQFESLKQECEQYLISILSLENAIHHLELAKVLSASKLLEASLLKIRQNIKEIWTNRDWQELGERNFPFFFWVCQQIIGDLN